MSINARVPQMQGTLNMHVCILYNHHVCVWESSTYTSASGPETSARIKAYWKFQLIIIYRQQTSASKSVVHPCVGMLPNVRLCASWGELCTRSPFSRWCALALAQLRISLLDSRSGLKNHHPF